MKGNVVEIILNAVGDVNLLLEEPIDLSKGEATQLYGEGALDSLSLVTLITSVEGAVEDHYNRTLTLASEKAFSMRNSPFSTVGRLADYVVEELGEAS